MILERISELFPSLIHLSFQSTPLQTRLEDSFLRRNGISLSEASWNRRSRRSRSENVDRTWSDSFDGDTFCRWRWKLAKILLRYNAALISWWWLRHSRMWWFLTRKLRQKMNLQVDFSGEPRVSIFFGRFDVDEKVRVLRDWFLIEFDVYMGVLWGLLSSNWKWQTIILVLFNL